MQGVVAISYHLEYYHYDFLASVRVMISWLGSDGMSWLLVGAFFQVILIDLIMSGDNALMISVTTQGLKKHDRRKAILFGVLGAMIMRIVFAFGLAQMLDFPWVKIVGAVLLFIVAGKLYHQFRNRPLSKKNHKTGSNRLHALGLIIVADISMSLDNVLAVASAAGDHPLALIVGIIVSIVLMTTIATVLSRLLEKFPWIKRGGFALIVFLAFKMLFTSIEYLIPFDYHLFLYRGIGMVGTFGIIYLHRRYMSDFEEQEMTKFIYTHMSFIVMVLLLLMTVFLAYGGNVHHWLTMHKPIWFTLFACTILLALEIASLERVKHKITLGE